MQVFLVMFLVMLLVMLLVMFLVMFLVLFLVLFLVMFLVMFLVVTLRFMVFLYSLSYWAFLVCFLCGNSFKIRGSQVVLFTKLSPMRKY